MAHNQSFAIQWSKEVFYSFVFPQELFCSKCIEVGDVTRESGVDVAVSSSTSASMMTGLLGK